MQSESLTVSGQTSITANINDILYSSRLTACESHELANSVDDSSV